MGFQPNRVIQSPKTERHEGKETRVAPLFPELLPILLEASETAEEGAEYVVGGKLSGSIPKPGRVAKLQSSHAI